MISYIRDLGIFVVVIYAGLSTWTGLDWTVHLDRTGLDWTGLSTWMDCLRSWTGSVDSPSTWTVQSNLTQTKARRKKFGSEKKLHQKMRRLKAQLMNMFSMKSGLPPACLILLDSATYGRRGEA